MRRLTLLCMVIGTPMTMINGGSTFASCSCDRGYPAYSYYASPAYSYPRYCYSGGYVGPHYYRSYYWPRPYAGGYYYRPAGWRGWGGAQSGWRRW